MERFLLTDPSTNVPLGDDWTECFTVNGISLPTAPFIGISAMTGDVSDNHEYVMRTILVRYPVTDVTWPSVIAITTSSAILSNPDTPRDQFRNNKPTDVGTSWFSSILKFLLFGAVLSGLWFAWKTYGARQGGRGFGSGLGSIGRGGPSLGAMAGKIYDSKRF